MMLFMTAETDNDFALNVSADSLRGRMTCLNAGYWPFGRVPFGYDRQYVEGDIVRMVVSRSEKFGKAKNWKLRLVVNENEAQVIRGMFDSLGRRDCSLRYLARDLSARGVLTPAGDAVWSVRSVVGVVTNPAYCEDTAIGVRRGGVKGKFNQAPVTVKASCIPIVDRELWASVQSRLAERKQTGRRVHTGRSSSLAGVLVCGHCGHRLVQKRRADQVYYICNSPSVRPGCGCKQWRVYESAVLPEVRRVLVEAVELEILRTAQARPVTADSAGDVDRLQVQVAELQKRIAKGAENLLLADGDTFPILQTKLGEWKSELLRVENTLTLLQSDPVEVGGLASAWAALRPSLVTILPGSPVQCVARPDGSQGCTVGELMGVVPVETTADGLRSLLLRLGCTVTLWWRPNGSRNYTLERGLVRAEFGEHVMGEYFSSGSRSIPN